MTYAALCGVTITTLTACSDDSINAADSTGTSVATTTTVAAPTLAVSWPRGAAANAQYWQSKVAKLNSDTKEFADYYAAEFCEKPDSAHTTAQLISFGIGLGQLWIPYQIWKKSNTPPAWKDDQNAETEIAYYIVSNYCPEPPK